MRKVKLISQAEYARHRGCDPTSVRDAIKAGRISLIDGKIDPVVADLQWKQNTRARVGATPTNDANLQSPAAPLSPPSDASGSDYWESRARREKAEADLAELRLLEQRGELVRAADVRTSVAKRAAAMRESLLQIPARLSAVLAAENDQVRIHEHLERELRQVLAQLADA